MAVDPGATRFVRQRALEGFGASGQESLASAHVVVVGAGGIGSAVLSTLAGAGIGRITVVDDARVEESHLHRHTLFGVDDIGRPKAEAAVDALRRLAPDADLTARVERFVEGATFDLLLDADVLVDGSDSRATRYLANDAAAVRGIPMVWGSALGWVGRAGVAWDERGVDYRDLHPEDASTDDVEDADGDSAGVLPAVCSVVAGIMAAETLKLLSGSGDPLLGRAVVYDARTGSFQEFTYHREDGAPRPGSIEERTTIPEPDTSHSVTAPQLAKLLAGASTLGVHEPVPVLLDVREDPEVSFVSLPGAVHIPLGRLPERLDELDRDAPLVVYCHHGVRSSRALGMLERAGFTRVRHLTGGIDAYAVQVDPELPRY
ncbi:ThiF family adenylyltransferase [Pseudolysinimonas sp.]|uniref:ThiF family adenylyltransferase n=1 Tax=Pseudolysinimonas sp. TaxID=2680009 RepID=UPI003F7DA98E